MTIRPLVFVVSAMRNVGQREWGYDYERNKSYEKYYSGPDYVTITLKAAPESSETESRSEIKLCVTEDVAKRFRLGKTVELWPSSGPRERERRSEVKELKRLINIEIPKP